MEKPVITVQRSKTERGAGVRDEAEGLKGFSWRRGHPGWVLKDEWELAEEGGGVGVRGDRGQGPSRQKEQRVQRHRSVKASTVLCLALLERKM